MQIVTTLRMDRRFVDAVNRLPDLSQSQQQSTLSSIRRAHGHFADTLESLEKRHREASSRRFQIELSSDLLSARHRAYGVTESDVQNVYEAAAQSGHLYSMAVSTGVLAQLFLFDDARFFECIASLEELNRRRHEPFQALAHALALRAWATDDYALAERAFDAARVDYRAAGWLPTEILLEEFRRRLTPIPHEQWLEPYDAIRARWLEVLSDVVARARARR